jgi:2,3-bisphosphoglycerate-dependent phosphoglycerate mutase
MSKVAIKERHGEKQFKRWRRGYDTRPPPVSSFSSSYPGNDDRYVANVRDVRYSFFESLIRSVGHRRLEFHRKFPKSESLRDCMARTIPFFKEKILPQSVVHRQNVLIASSENAIRGLLMHLCEIPPESIHEVEIPTGLPILYNFRTKCVQLLDDGGYDNGDPLERYDFGSNPELLFRPCGVDDDECFLPTTIGGRSYAYNPLIRLPQDPAADADDDE